MFIREILHFNSEILKQRMKCAFQKMFKTSRPLSLHPHNTEGIRVFLGVEGSQRPKHLKKCSRSIGISRGVGGSWKKNLPWERYGNSLELHNSFSCTDSFVGQKERNT